MTGAGAPGAPGIIHCLQQEPFRLIVADADEHATGRYLKEHFIQIPKASDKEFIPELLRICTEEKVDVILPLVTRELFLLAEHQALFEEQGIKVLVSSHQAIQVANNKTACYQFLQSKGIKVPQFFAVHSVDEFKHAIKNLGYPQVPVCFKPSVSNGSRGFRIVAQKDEAELLFNTKPYQEYIRFEDALRILSSKPFPQLLVSSYLPGEEFSVDCLADNGKAKLVVPRLRTKMINGISVQGAIVRDDAIINYCAQIIEAIGLHGNIGIQVKRNEEGVALLLEINPRVQGTIVAVLGAGVNLPVMAVKQACGLPITPQEMEIKWGTRFSRYWTEVYY